MMVLHTVPIFSKFMTCEHVLAFICGQEDERPVLKYDCVRMCTTDDKSMLEPLLKRVSPDDIFEMACKHRAVQVIQSLLDLKCVQPSIIGINTRRFTNRHLTQLALRLARSELFVMELLPDACQSQEPEIVQYCLDNCTPTCLSDYDIKDVIITCVQYRSQRSLKCILSAYPQYAIYAVACAFRYTRAPIVISAHDGVDHRALWEKYKGEFSVHDHVLCLMDHRLNHIYK